MRYRLRTLLILLAIGPPTLAGMVYIAVPAGNTIGVLLAIWPLLLILSAPQLLLLLLSFLTPAVEPCLRWLLRMGPRSGERQAPPTSRPLDSN
jgi:hypothetical protein